MKKFLVIPVMFLYLLAVSGVNIYAHYCGKALESWSLYAATDGCGDGACGDEKQKSDDCCKDKVIASKVAQDQHFAGAFKLKPGADIFDAQPAPVFATVKQKQVIAAVFPKAHKSNAPPGLWQYIPLYKLHTRFTYYG